MSLTKKVSFSKISGIYSPKSPHNTSLQTEISRNASLRVEAPSSPSSSLRTRNKLSIENEIKSCLVDLRDLEEIELTAALWKRKHRPEYYTAKRERVDVNTAQKIRTLLSTLMLEEKEGRKLSSERSFLLEKADKLPLEFEEKQEHLRNIVHLTEGGKVNIAELENEATCLKRKLAQLHENRRTMQNGLHTKSKEIDKLLNELINLRDLEDQYLETINALRSVRSQQGELKEEEKTLRRLESRKLVFLNTLEKPSDFHDQINDLNSEKSVLHHRIRTRAQRKDIQSSSIHANNHELAVVEQQLHYLTLALKNHIKTRAEKSGPLSNESFSKSTGGNSTHTVVALEVEPSQMVPAGMLENVLGRIQQLRKTLALNHEQIKQRDVTVEKMERSIDILSHASESAQRRAEYEMKLHVEEYAQMQSIMEHRQSMFEEACEKLKQQQEQLKQRLEKLDMAFETQNSMEN